MVAIRPQGVCIAPASETAPGTPGRIMTRHFLGEIDLFDVAVEGFESYLRGKARAGDGLEPGAEEVRVSFDPRDVFGVPGHREPGQ
jgi:iron(III) transport system ATP-binding protein